MVYFLIDRYQVQFYQRLFLPCIFTSPFECTYIHKHLRICWNLNQGKGLASGLICQSWKFSYSLNKFLEQNAQEPCIVYVVHVLWEATWTLSHLTCMSTSPKKQLCAVVQNREKDKCWSISRKRCREIASKYCSSFTISKCLFCSIFAFTKILNFLSRVICKIHFWTLWNPFWVTCVFQCLCPI